MKSTISLTLIACLVAPALNVVAQGRSGTSADPPIGPLARTIARAAVQLAVTELNTVTEVRLQSPDDNGWSKVTQLTAGEDVRVVLDAQSYRGTFRMADGQSLTLTIASHDHRLSRARVRQVSVARATRRRRNILIGLVIGGATSAIAVGLHCRREASSCKEVAPAYFYPLAGAGAALGALLPAAKIWQEVYARAEP